MQSKDREYAEVIFGAKKLGQPVTAEYYVALEHFASSTKQWQQFISHDKFVAAMTKQDRLALYEKIRPTYVVLDPLSGEYGMVLEYSNANEPTHTTNNQRTFTEFYNIDGVKYSITDFDGPIEILKYD